MYRFLIIAFLSILLIVFKCSGLHLQCGVNLTLCCFVVYSTRRFVLCLNIVLFCSCVFSPLSIAITSLGEERANFSVFRTFVRFVLVLFYRFLLSLDVWKGLRL